MLYDHGGEIKSKRVVLGLFFSVVLEKKKERNQQTQANGAHHAITTATTCYLTNSSNRVESRKEAEENELDSKTFYCHFTLLSCCLLFLSLFLFSVPHPISSTRLSNSGKASTQKLRKFMIFQFP